MITIDDVTRAANRIAPYVKCTPVLTCSTFDRLLDAQLFFKCENFQRAGAFKIRGATNAVLSLSDDQLRHGVATHSSGNHGAALALAASSRNAPAYIAMPHSAPQVKQDAVQGYGAVITLCEPTLASRERTLAELVEAHSATVIHPYNDARVIAGQGSVALELLSTVGDLDYVLCPVGGGGLISGTAITVTSLSPKTMVIGVEPEKANDAFLSLAENRIMPQCPPSSIADGLLSALGSLTFPIIKNNVSQIILASDEMIIEATRLIWERMKIVVEPSGAVCLAALLQNQLEITGKRIGIILSGGNVDLYKLPWLK